MFISSTLQKVPAFLQCNMQKKERIQGVLKIFMELIGESSCQITRDRALRKRQAWVALEIKKSLSDFVLIIIAMLHITIILVS